MPDTEYEVMPGGITYFEGTLTEAGAKSVHSYVTACEKAGTEPNFEEFSDLVGRSSEEAFWLQFGVNVNDVARTAFATGYAFAIWQEEEKRKVKIR